MDVNIPEEMLPDVTFACGPSQGHPRIRRTPVCEMLFERSHRAPDVSSEGLYAEAAANIKKLLRVPDDYLLLFFQGGATPALDAAAWNLAEDSISGYRFGAFSRLWGAKIAEELPPDVSKTFVDCGDGETLPADGLDMEASLILLTPNETSTGVAVPDDMLTRIYEEASSRSLVAWDCTSCAGGRLLPEKEYDVMVFSLQKCFGCPGGTGVMILSPRAVERAEAVCRTRAVPHSLRLGGPKRAIDRAVSGAQTANTPCTPSIWMANEAAKVMLEAGGLEAMDALVKRHAEVIWAWVEKSGYLAPYVKDTRFRSDITITLAVDDSVDAAEISRALAATGRPNLQDGVKKYSAVPGNLIRIACFPFIDFDGTEQFEKLTRTIDFIVDALKKEGTR